MKTKERIGVSLSFLNKYSAIIALIVIVLYGTLFVPYFMSSANLKAILFQYSIIGFLALGQLLVIISGGIDLSQGSLLAFTSIVAAVLIAQMGLFPAVAGAILCCSLLGFASGLLVSRTKIPAFIVTLGMLGIGRGLAKFVANAKPVPIADEFFRSIGRAEILEVPVCAIAWFIASLAMFHFLKRRRMGRYIYAVGSSEESARLAGINIRRVKLFVYTMSAFLTSIGALIWASRLGSGSPIGGVGYELESIASVIVGGASLYGGTGSVVGTVAGVMIFGVINSILNLSGISPFWQGAIKGILILSAVALSQIQLRNNRKV